MTSKKTDLKEQKYSQNKKTIDKKIEFNDSFNEKKSVIKKNTPIKEKIDSKHDTLIESKIALKSNKSIVLIRTFLELSAVGVGFYLGGIVGIGTLIYAIGIGFSVSTGLFVVGKIYKYNFHK